ncbi:beta-lactamase [Spirosoma linguale DSM 74]|uniref:Beta-lactamase n=2 Tax=Spirosoma TaxID=107 RepID=D2QGR9_SPILD|nr:beta-lactamase [Spirosoma linguale DSM 74]
MRAYKTPDFTYLTMKFILIFCLFIQLGKPSWAQVPAISAKTQQQIDSLFAPYNKLGLPGFSLGILAPSKVLLSKGYGMANLDYNLPNSSVTVYNIASLSKQFTAACIALLILRDSLSLDDPVAMYIPQLSQYADTIRIKHLVYMTSGIHEYHQLPRKNGLNWNLYDYFTVDTAIQASLSQPKLDFVPGSQWAYSNVNYMLLTKIVEKVSGKRFSQFAQENLFMPLGMGSTQVNDDVTMIIPNRATGYIPLTPSLIEQTRQAGYYLQNRTGYAQVHRNAPHYGGSGVFTSVHDWFLWNQNFYTHKLGGKRFYELMHQRMRFNHSKDNDAFGLVFGSFEGEEIIWYSGGDIGFNSYFMRFPKQELTVVCFSNFDSAGQAEKLAHQVGRILIQNKVLTVKKSSVK